MEISYNDIDLEVVRTNSYDQQAVYSEDGADYLYTRHILDVQCIFNPYATSFNVEGNQSYGQLPAVTMRAIRQRLLEPRKVLIVGVDGDILLNEPAPLDSTDRWDGSVDLEDRFTTDAFNGPKPISCTINQVAGKKSFIVQYKIETCVNECTTAGTLFNKAVDNPILSHRWQSATTVDDQFFSVRVIEGRAKFRTDWLTAVNEEQAADAFREAFFHYIEPRFKRDQINVYATSDGSEIAYTVIDREQPYSLGETSPATKIEAFYSVVGQKPDAAEKEPGIKPFLSGVVQVRIFGRAGQLNWYLYKKAVEIVVFKLPPQKIFKWTYREALHAPYVELEATALLSPSSTADKDVIPGGLRIKPPPGVLDPVPGVLVRSQFKNPRPGDTATGTSTNTPHSRGWALTKLLTAALKNECDPIKKPQRGDEAF